MRVLAVSSLPPQASRLLQQPLTTQADHFPASLPRALCLANTSSLKAQLKCHLLPVRRKGLPALPQTNCACQLTNSRGLSFLICSRRVFTSPPRVDARAEGNKVWKSVQPSDGGYPGPASSGTPPYPCRITAAPLRSCDPSFYHLSQRRDYLHTGLPLLKNREPWEGRD